MLYSDELDNDRVRLTLRCGGCGAFRQAVLGPDRAQAVERRIERRMERDRRDIRDALRRIERAGVDPVAPDGLAARVSPRGHA